MGRVGTVTIGSGALVPGNKGHINLLQVLWKGIAILSDGPPCADDGEPSSLEVIFIATVSNVFTGVNFHGVNKGDWRCQADKGHVGKNRVGPPVIIGMDSGFNVPHIDVGLAAIILLVETCCAHVPDLPVGNVRWVGAVVAIRDALLVHGKGWVD